MAKKEKKENGIFTNIKVVGVGGGGGNAVSRMARDFVKGVEFIAINTDQQDLDQCDVKRKIHIGRNLTRGMGTGMNPEIGRKAAEENRSEIAEALRDAHIVFISAGMGGGTGSGASPVVAEVAKENGSLTIAVVTKPFAFEGVQRQRIAEDAIVRLHEKVDALIVVPNDRIFSIISKDTPILRAFQAIDDVLRNALRGIVELIVTPGIINVDFADVKTIIQDSGSAIVGIGVSGGQDRAVAAVNQALNSPLLEVSAEGARGVLLGISGGRDLRMTEINEAAKLVAQTVDPACRIIFGAYYDKNLKPNQIKITLIATSFDESARSKSPAPSLFSGAAPASAPSRPEKPLNSFIATAADEIGNEEDDDVLKKFARGMDSPSVAKKDDAKAEADAKKKDKDADIWDIPTFLRKKR